MTPNRNTTIVLALLALVYASLAFSFVLVPARPGFIKRAPLVAQDTLDFAPGTIRVSASQLIHGGGDASGLDCYACHHQESPPVITYDADHQIVLPKEHTDLIISMRNCAECHPPDDPVKLDYDAAGVVVVPKGHEGLLRMAHGRNNACFNCHDREQLNQLHTPEGVKLTFEQATLLCASCHGTTYRDWQAGAHGRTGGHWLRFAGPFDRQECTSCHDPHAPRFTGLIPLPGPHLLHPLPKGVANPPPPTTD